MGFLGFSDFGFMGLRVCFCFVGSSRSAFGGCFDDSEHSNMAQGVGWVWVWSVSGAGEVWSRVQGDWGAEAKAIRSSSPRARKAKILEPEMFGTFWEVQRKDLQHHSAKKGVPNTTGVLHQGLGFLEGLLQGFSA